MTTRTQFTTSTPFPPNTNLETAVKSLHSHDEMIKLNPLVITFKKCDPPANAPAEEQNLIWYEITDKVPILPFNLYSREVTYKACFENLVVGLRTHVYAPMGLDIREVWSVGGATTTREGESAGDGSGEDTGLYLKEDVDMSCNFLMAGFVKGTLKVSHGRLFEKMVARSPKE
ncbi:uncharacterized protein BDV14DRAFT_176798 [Aspergillus stella-maris]|uniref:uncharacterized protein n=1 Tax=Aspergillus stella-maris TaxID=1810926 RepID=UPI003CCD0B82